MGKRYVTIPTASVKTETRVWRG